MSKRHSRLDAPRAYADPLELDRRPERRGRGDQLPRRHPHRSGGRRGAGGQARVLREADGADARRRRPGDRRRRATRAWRCRSASTAASPPTSPRRTTPIDDGAIGTPQLLRSLTRDPGISAEAGRARQAVDDLQRDPDPRLRHAVLAQPGRPGHRGLRAGRRADPPAVRRRRLPGHLGGAAPLRQRRVRRPPRPASRPSTATTCAARCSAPAVVLLAGDATPEHGRHSSNTELFADAYVGAVRRISPTHVRAGTTPSVTGHDARVALEIALGRSRIRPHRRPVALAAAVRSMTLRPGRLRRDGVHRPRHHRAGRAGSTSWASRWRSGAGTTRTSTRWPPPAPASRR